MEVGISNLRLKEPQDGWGGALFKTFLQNQAVFKKKKIVLFCWFFLPRGAGLEAQASPSQNKITIAPIPKRNDPFGLLRLLLSFFRVWAVRT